MSSPANRTALREEENRPALPSQQVIASAATGPTPYSRAARTFAPVRLREASSSSRRSTSSRASRAPSMVQRDSHLQLPAGDRKTPAAARAASRSRALRSAPPGPGRPGGRTPRGRAAPRRCARPAGHGRSPAAPGTPGSATAGSSTRQPALGQQLPQVPRVGLVGLGVPLAAAGEGGVSRLGDMRRDAGRGQFLGDVPPAGAPLQRERDIVPAGEPRQPGPQVHTVGRATWPRFTSPVTVSR